MPLKTSIHISLIGLIRGLCIFETLFGYRDILILGTSPIKWRHRPDMTYASIQTNNKRNIPMQYTKIFSGVKIEKLHRNIFAQNIDCGYMLEQPRILYIYFPVLCGVIVSGSRTQLRGARGDRIQYISVWNPMLCYSLV